MGHLNFNIQHGDRKYIFDIDDEKGTWVENEKGDKHYFKNAEDMNNNLFEAIDIYFKGMIKKEVKKT